MFREVKQQIVAMTCWRMKVYWLIWTLFCWLLNSLIGSEKESFITVINHRQCLKLRKQFIIKKAIYDSLKPMRIKIETYKDANIKVIHWQGNLVHTFDYIIAYFERWQIGSFPLVRLPNKTRNLLLYGVQTELEKSTFCFTYQFVIRFG